MASRVLCIEGNEALRKRVTELLEAAGFAVEATASGLEGIERALALPPDLILTDAHLPDLEGWELAARLRAERSLQHVPIVTVGDSAEEHDSALAAGADGFLPRGADDHLGDEVRAFLAGKRERLSDEGERATLRAMSATMAAHLQAALAAEQRATAKLLELDRLKSAFMHNLAHELSTPLTPLAGYLRIFQADKLGPLTAQQRRIVDSMIHSVARLTRVVDNLSDFASLQTGRALILEGPVEPDLMADEVVAEQRSAVKDARLHVSVAHAGGGAVAADPRKLRQALSNLVSNAVKFSPHGGEVLVEVAREGGWLRWAVYDQGPGIRPAEQERIFEPLHHAAVRGSDEARRPGSGLGLPVALRIAEAHGGRVVVESPPRTQPRGVRHFNGSKFVLEIPLRPVERAAAAGAPAGGEGYGG
ncbi:MAG TPA: ATP-binding protein [Anaeromyxobacter sp.]|nr:ATP-binding protein [Anaeromyxobacter sp.]